MREASDDWLIAANGIYRGKPGDTWTLLGDYRFTVNQILREPDGSLTVAAANGLWQVPEDRSAMWVQLHDETSASVYGAQHACEPRYARVFQVWQFPARQFCISGRHRRCSVSAARLGYCSPCWYLVLNVSDDVVYAGCLP
jgi:hypothetical protein